MEDKLLDAKPEIIKLPRQNLENLWCGGKINNRRLFKREAKKSKIIN